MGMDVLGRNRKKLLRPRVLRPNEDKVIEIRSLYKAGAGTMQERAECYNVSRTAIHRTTWTTRR